MIEAQEFSQMTGIRHGFFDRQGGASQGLYACLNCGLGSDDDRDTVLNNRATVASHLKLAPPQLITAYQHHSADVVTVTKPWDITDAPMADGMVTNIEHIGLGLLTADCAPVLFADPHAHVIGAAHAGWRGAVAGICDNTITAMENLGAQRASIVAVIGPTISQSAYEVGPEFIENFLEQNPAHEQFFTPSSRDKHFMFDLPGYLIQRLKRADIASVSSVGNCTYTAEDKFFSYRRATHKSEKDYGRQISVITLN
jgi:purine-nucleoside/S-methyl-5'-thioadenosine phosphorylase / adenosine deaminase